ncbi:MAG: carbon monoxide dehydrogenase subunit G [Rhodovarius sp.]|nr:carbon monoxide dehydrogenase subunit G [Rhodovarius sp.]MCX7931664.1 carbon monoxide dehydrogenase subunit G [Rhodovarius sp.]MDW8314170.1 carbon monoxide dehydrogenase subunit G [Rhodovarius sp.]
MDMTGERLIPAPRERVWAALNDPAVLQAAIPGCEALEKHSDTELTARVALKIGPMAARFTVKVALSDLDPPARYIISGEGQGGAMGFAKGSAEVRLEEHGPQETRLTYAAKAQVGGKMAQLGARLIDATAKQMSDQFFDRFAAQLAASSPAPAAEQPAAPAPAPGLSMLSLIPKEFAGMPLAFWIGSLLFLWVLYLLFLST